MFAASIGIENDNYIRMNWEKFKIIQETHSAELFNNSSILDAVLCDGEIVAVDCSNESENVCQITPFDPGV